jgi:hypothetical protein
VDLEHPLMLGKCARRHQKWDVGEGRRAVIQLVNGDGVASESNSDPRFRNDGFSTGEGAFEVYAGRDNGDICDER